MGLRRRLKREKRNKRQKPEASEPLAPETLGEVASGLEAHIPLGLTRAAWRLDKEGHRGTLGRPSRGDLRNLR